MKRGFFVSFEGIDQSGKTTQLFLLKKRLEEKGISVLYVREPGGTKIGEQIREILLDKGNLGMSRETELLLFEAARAQIVREVILPAMRGNKIVFCDRFFDATIAYQAFARGLDRAHIDFLNHFATDGLEPDLTFLLDLSPETAMQRRKGNDIDEDRLEVEGLDFMGKVRDGYLHLAADCKRITVFDATASTEELAQKIAHRFWEVVNETDICNSPR